MRIRTIRAVSVVAAIVAAAVGGMAAPASAAPAVLERVNPTFASYPAMAATFTVSGNVTATAAFVDAQVPPPPTPNTSTSGCETADFAGFTPGWIALIQRGTCTFAVKAANAQAAGASAVVIFNEGQPGRTDVFPLSLGAPGVTIPVVSTSFAAGEEMYLLRLSGLQVHVMTTSSSLDSCASPPASGTPVGGRNVIVAQPGVATTGTAGADVIYGTAGPDRIDGAGGDDLIFGLGGNDLLQGGDGHDTLCGGDGNDYMAGGGGDDALAGGAGNDQLLGGTGNDELVDGSGYNGLNGGDGGDFCSTVGSMSSSVQECETVAT